MTAQTHFLRTPSSRSMVDRGPAHRTFMFAGTQRARSRVAELTVGSLYRHIVDQSGCVHR